MTKLSSNTSAPWVQINQTDVQHITVVRDYIPTVDERDLRDCLPPQQRPKFEERNDYTFLILLFPHYLRDTKAIVTKEVDVFLAQDRVITVHDGSIPIFAELERRGSALPSLPIEILLMILEQLLDYCSPILVHLQNDIHEQEQHIAARFEESRLITTSLLRRNVIAFRRAFLPNAHAIARLRDTLREDASRNTRKQLDRIIDKTNEILLLLEDFATTIAGIHDTQQAIVTYRTNRVMTTLTIIAVLTFPLSLIAGIFGMDTFEMPIVGMAHDFWIIVGGMGVIALAMLGYFKAKRWF